MQKHVNLVDLVKSFPTNIFLQNLASIQKRTSPIKFAHLVEKTEKGSISNLSTKDETSKARGGRAEPDCCPVFSWACIGICDERTGVPVYRSRYTGTMGIPVCRVPVRTIQVKKIPVLLQ